MTDRTPEEEANEATRSEWPVKAAWDFLDADDMVRAGRIDDAVLIVVSIASHGRSKDRCVRWMESLQGLRSSIGDEEICRAFRDQGEFSAWWRSTMFLRAQLVGSRNPIDPSALKFDPPLADSGSEMASNVSKDAARAELAVLREGLESLVGRAEQTSSTAQAQLERSRLLRSEIRAKLSQAASR